MTVFQLGNAGLSVCERSLINLPYRKNDAYSEIPICGVGTFRIVTANWEAVTICQTTAKNGNDSVRLIKFIMPLLEREVQTRTSLMPETNFSISPRRRKA